MIFFFFNQIFWDLFNIKQLLQDGVLNAHIINFNSNTQFCLNLAHNNFIDETTISMKSYAYHIYKFSKSICDGGFGGWGKGEVSEATGDFFS